MSKKPLTYLFHPSMFLTTQEHMRRLVGRDMRGISRRQLIQDISRSEPDFNTSLNFQIFAEDLHFERSDRNVLIPESDHIFKELIRAKYSMTSAKGFCLPFKSFVLCMPEGFEIDGVAIPPCLVNYGKYENAPQELIYPFCEYLDLPKPQVNLESASPGANALSITYKEQGTIAYARVMAVDDDLPGILSADTPDACREAIGEYGFFDRLVNMSEQDTIIQFYLLKIVSSIGIYLLANKQQGIRSGFPGKTVPRLVGRDPKFSVRMHTLLNKPPVEDNFDIHQSRRWHFSHDVGIEYNEPSMKDVKLNWLWN